MITKQNKIYRLKEAGDCMRGLMILGKQAIYSCFGIFGGK